MREWNLIKKKNLFSLSISLRSKNIDKVRLLNSDWENSYSPIQQRNKLNPFVTMLASRWGNSYKLHHVVAELPATNGKGDIFLSQIEFISFKEA